MSKKVLIIASSPRKDGNSDILCDEFRKGAKNHGNAVETVYLREKNINFCRGCEACHQTGGKCVQKDDVAEIIDKMLKADVIVLASPVYFYTICAQMKALIDRCVAKYTEISGKEFYYILTAADNDKDMLEKSVDCFRGFTLDCLNNPIERGIVYGTGAWKKGDIRSQKSMKEAYEMGENV